MNWNKLILAGSVALALVAVPLVTAEAQTRGGGARVAAAPSGGMSGGRVGGMNNGSRWSGSGSNHHWTNNGGNHNWGNHNWGHHHRHYYYPYYAFGYPYGFGYPFGYGYGYYPYGSYYYDGSYDGRYYSSRGGSVAVEVQRKLARVGYYHGSIDGVIGNGTRRAIRAFERDNGLPVDGRIDDDLLAAMRIS